jgi:hypothetical protein
MASDGQMSGLTPCCGCEILIITPRLVLQLERASIPTGMSRTHVTRSRDGSVIHTPRVVGKHPGVKPCSACETPVVRPCAGLLYNPGIIGDTSVIDLE